MKIFYTSDIHCDTYHFAFSLTDMGVDIEAYDVFVFAGDLTNGHPPQLKKILDQIKHKQVIIILGNHDYWNNEFADAPSKFKRYMNREGYSNVHVLDYDINPFVVIEDTVFIGSTLWTDVGDTPAHAALVTSNMPDCSRIITKTGLLKQGEVYAVHLETMKVFEDCRNMFPQHKKVLVTHHCLSHLLLAEEYQRSTGLTARIMNRGYYSSYDEWIEHVGFDAIISGHTHVEKDFMIGETRMLSNPLGYPGDPYATFKEDALLEI